MKYKIYNKYRPADFFYFDSIKAIKKYTKDTHKSISMAIINNYQTDNGFYIEKIEEEVKKRPQIVVFDSTGKVYKEFTNKKECLECMKISYGKLTKLIENGDADEKGYTYDEI